VNAFYPRLCVGKTPLFSAGEAGRSALTDARQAAPSGSGFLRLTARDPTPIYTLLLFTRRAIASEAAMPDSTTTVAELRQWMRQFVAERDWEQFHSPKNLVMGLSVEVAELMEHFLWVDIEQSRKLDDEKRGEVADELADVTLYVLALSNTLGLDLSEAVSAKLVKTARKYPVERCRGRFKAEPQSVDECEK
jgi:dCTP diphosphatase